MKDQQEYFVVLRLHRDDLKAFMPAEQADHLSDALMQKIADDVGLFLFGGDWDDYLKQTLIDNELIKD
jgi:hypothetical protein